MRYRRHNVPYGRADYPAKALPYLVFVFYTRNKLTYLIGWPPTRVGRLQGLVAHLKTYQKFGIVGVYNYITIYSNYLKILL
jgi:hypothetical protein